MTLQAGDREFGHGDQPTVVNDTDSTIEEGVPVKVTGHDGDHPLVEVASGDGAADGVTADAVGAGDYIQMVSHGIVWVQTTGDVPAGDEVAEVGSSGFDTGGSEYRVYEGNDSPGGIALIRFEN